MYIMHWVMPFIIWTWITFVKSTFSKSIIFNVKSTFELNVLKWIIKIIFISSSPFALLIINVKILANFQKVWCTFGRKIGCLEKTTWSIHFWILNDLNMQKHFWFVSSFEHVNFASNKKYSKKILTIQVLCFTCDLLN